jgi:outer membrane protein OmpA-like peptidoglycan-associated protein
VTVDLDALGARPATDAPAEAPVHLHPPKAAKAPSKPSPRRAAAPPKPQHKPAVDAARTPPPKAPQPQAAAAEPPATQPPSPPVAANGAPDAATAAPPLPGMLQIPPPPALPPPTLPAAATATSPAQTAPAKTAAASPPPTQPPPRAETAAAKPGATETTTRLVFPAGAVELSADAKADLDRCAKRLVADRQLRAEIDGYAEAGDASQARRISLSRVLAARGYLVERGVDVKQVDVRPLGNRTQPGLPPDRVDLVIAER